MHIKSILNKIGISSYPPLVNRTLCIVELLSFMILLASCKRKSPLFFRGENLKMNRHQKKVNNSVTNLSHHSKKLRQNPTICLTR